MLADCTLPGHPEVFAVGDMMALDGLPGVAEVAMQSGIHAARTIRRRLQDDGAGAGGDFVYRDLGSMATISRFRAIVSFKGIKVGGVVGWLMWAFVHLTFLTGFKNRWIALFKWISAFVGSSRDERTITMQQATARVIAERAGAEARQGRHRPCAERRRRLLTPAGPRSVQALEQVVADAQRVRHRRKRRVHSRDAREEAGVDDIEVVEFVRAAVRSSTEAAGSDPKRQVPAWWATPATGILFSR